MAFLFPVGKTFNRGNLALPAYGNPDANSLCTGWPRDDAAAGVKYLLKTCWRTIEKYGYIAEALSGHSFFEVTEEGRAVVSNPTNVISPERAIVDAIRFLHPDLQGYAHYLREGKLKEAVTVAFMRVENRLNEAPLA